MTLLMAFACIPLTAAADSGTGEIVFRGRTYTPTLTDEFDTLDFDKWGYCPEMERQDLGGIWRNENSTVEDGNLVITCGVLKDGTPVSGGVRSQPDCGQTYGLYHIRFKMEFAPGLWYAFWLYTDKMEEGSVGNGATDGAELDIIEMVPGANDGAGELCMSVHWDGYGDELKTCCEVADLPDGYFDGFYDSYHELWYEWDPDGYRLYLDGTDDSHLLFDFPGNEEKYGDGTCAVPCDLVISAEFGKWGGDIDAAQLPAHFYVDYVHVYKQAPGPSLERGKVTAPEGAVLLLAEYDADGRLSRLQSKTLQSDVLDASPAALGLDVPECGAYRLMLVSGDTFAPLCGAWRGCTA